jgi:hypothetical protein
MRYDTDDYLVVAKVRERERLSVSKRAGKISDMEIINLGKLNDLEVNSSSRLKSQGRFAAFENLDSDDDDDDELDIKRDWESTVLDRIWKLQPQGI